MQLGQWSGMNNRPELADQNGKRHSTNFSGQRNWMNCQECLDVPLHSNARPRFGVQQEYNNLIIKKILVTKNWIMDTVALCVTWRAEVERDVTTLWFLQSKGEKKTNWT